jgi:autonomous glycyl radical cofactor GrcA
MSRPENENPKELEKTARELRKHRPRPSEALVSRIERLAERSAARRSRPARVSRRRLVLALAAALVIAVAGAVVHGELQTSSKTTNAKARNQTLMQGANPFTHKAVRSVGGVSTTPSPQASTPDVKRSALNQYREMAPPTAAKSATYKRASGTGMPSLTKTGVRQLDHTAQITSGNRLAELRAVLTLKVANSDQLSQRTAQAMKIARSLSGYVVSTQTNVPSRGVATSYLVLKVPATRSQDALIAISGLGKILSQDISLEDVKGTVTSESQTIQALKREIASLEQTLSQQTLTPQARSQLQIELARDRARLSSLQTQRTKDILRGRLATITLTLTTGDLPKLPTSPSRIHKAIDKAWNGLSSEISWAATGLIVASPFLLLAAVAALLVRSRRRREERRLLEK